MNQAADKHCLSLESDEDVLMVLSLVAGQGALLNKTTKSSGEGASLQI